LLDLAHRSIREKDAFLANLAATIDGAVDVKLAMEKTV
jgi:hypothetical protein